MRCRGKVEKGKLLLYEREALELHLQSLEGKQIRLTVEIYRQQRSNDQNALYWKIVTVFAEHLGYDKDDLHYELKRKFLCVDPDAPIVRVKSTTELNTQEFSQYVDSVIRLAAEYGCAISDAR